MQVTSIVGARPQFVKLAPIAEAFVSAGVDHRIVHTGQHYDEAMSASFFEQLRIPAPDVDLGIGSGSHGRQTGTMLAAIEEDLVAARPDWVLVYGDTNSTIAGALAAVKLHVPTAHLEAGLRSYNRRMPEEHNRVLTDHASDLLLAPSTTAVDNLRSEGLEDRTVHVGDVMVDVLLRVAASVAEAPPPQGLPEDGTFALATIHRAENTDDPQRLRAIVDGLADLPWPVVLAAHPRLRDRAADAGIDLAQGNVLVRDPLAYPDLVAALQRARLVVTDSGGLQKEAFVLGIPCVTVRTETEWTETVDLGWNVLCPQPAGIAAAAATLRAEPTDATPYGSGDAAVRVTEALIAGPGTHTG